MNTIPPAAIALLFTDKRWNPIAKAIRWRHNSEWSHVDIVRPYCPRVPNSVIGARMWHGVHVREFDAAIRGVSSWAIGIVRDPPGTPDELRKITPESVAAAHAWAWKQRGKGYDYAGAFAIGVDARNWRNDRRWFCSELAEAMFEEIGYPLVDKDARLVPPDMLYTSTRVEKRGHGFSWAELECTTQATPELCCTLDGG